MRFERAAAALLATCSNLVFDKKFIVVTAETGTRPQVLQSGKEGDQNFKFGGGSDTEVYDFDADGNANSGGFPRDYVGLKGFNLAFTGVEGEQELMDIRVRAKQSDAEVDFHEDDSDYANYNWRVKGIQLPPSSQRFTHSGSNGSGCEQDDFTATPLGLINAGTHYPVLAGFQLEFQTTSGGDDDHPIQEIKVELNYDNKTVDVCFKDSNSKTFDYWVYYYMIPIESVFRYGTMSLDQGTRSDTIDLGLSGNPIDLSDYSDTVLQGFHLDATGASPIRRVEVDLGVENSWAGVQFKNDAGQLTFDATVDWVAICSEDNCPTYMPSSQPSSSPSTQPSSQPSEAPSANPSSSPSTQPSSQPSEAPSANPSQGCENTRTDCGWGIFNPWTCRCDCPVGICLDNNEQCYHPCRDTIHTNPWAGCSPGWDCPWFPDREHGHCISELHQPNNFEIYRTAKECCDEHYSGSSTCVQQSKEEHDPFPWPIHFPGTQPWSRPFAPEEIEGEGTNNEHHWGTEAGNQGRWFPDLINQLNCVWGNNYEEWMTNEGFEEDYLFLGYEDCCEKWYPDKADCPSNMEAVDPEAEDEPWHSSPFSMDNYYFPDFSKDNCGHGWDYPAWMGINAYEKHYLFRDGQDCCKKFFPNVGGCPMETAATNTQMDYYWTTYEDNIDNLDDMPVKYNHTFYPDVLAGNCINGTDYPEWMGSDVDYKRLYLFKTNEGCCTQWFTTFDLQGCLNGLVQGVYVDQLPCHLNRPDEGPETIPCDETLAAQYAEGHPLQNNQPFDGRDMWYPDLDGMRCKNDGYMELWMLKEDYKDWYLFTTRQACCSAFGFC